MLLKYRLVEELGVEAHVFTVFCFHKRYARSRTEERFVHDL
jgi:hypothetical protein